MKTNYSKTTFILMISLLLLNLSCRKPITENKTNTALYRTFGKAPCACIPNYTNSNCSECITKLFMDNKTTAEYQAYFTNCQTDDPNGGSCQPDITHAYKITFCFAEPDPNIPNDCSLLMQIDDAPNCIPCIQSLPICVKVKASCTLTNNKDYVLRITSSDPLFPSTIEMTYTISQDPKISICCKKIDPNNSSIFYTYCCSGDLIKAI